MKLFFLLILSIQVFANPIPYEDGDFWGYKNKAGKIVIPPKYAMAQGFNKHGIASVVYQRKWIYINTKGEKVAEAFNYDNGPDYLSDGLSRIINEEGKIGFMDEKGKTIIPPQFDFAEPFEKGKSRVCRGCKIDFKKDEHGEIVGGDWGVINKKGKLIVPYTKSKK